MKNEENENEMTIMKIMKWKWRNDEMKKMIMNNNENNMKNDNEKKEWK